MSTGFLKHLRGNIHIFVSLRQILKDENTTLLSLEVTKQTPVGVFTCHEGGEVLVYLYLMYCHISHKTETVVT